MGLGLYKGRLGSQVYLILKNIHCFFIQFVGVMIDDFQVFGILFFTPYLSNIAL
jgi:hypothetical protein